MTRAKDPDRRYDWPPGRATAGAILASARFHYLCVAAEVHPTMLAEMLALPRSDESELLLWVHRWGLEAEWCLAQVRDSLAQHDGGSIDLVRHGWGAACDELTPFGWSGDVALDPPEWTHKTAEHFEWLARDQAGDSYAAIAGGALRSPQTVHEACHRLAGVLGLPLRPTLRGRRPIS